MNTPNHSPSYSNSFEIERARQEALSLVYKWTDKDRINKKFDAQQQLIANSNQQLNATMGDMWDRAALLANITTKESDLQSKKTQLGECNVHATYIADMQSQSQAEHQKMIDSYLAVTNSPHEEAILDRDIASLTPEVAPLQTAIGKKGDPALIAILSAQLVAKEKELLGKQNEKTRIPSQNNTHIAVEIQASQKIEQMLNIYKFYRDITPIDAAHRPPMPIAGTPLTVQRLQSELTWLTSAIALTQNTLTVEVGDEHSWLISELKWLNWRLGISNQCTNAQFNALSAKSQEDLLTRAFKGLLWKL